MITQAEGGIIALDAHLDELLHLYTEEHNAWFRKAAEGRECPYPAQEITREEMARLILGRFLHEWAAERKGGKR